MAPVSSLNTEWLNTSLIPMYLNRLIDFQFLLDFIIIFDLIRVCLQSPTSALRLLSKWSFTPVNSHFSSSASLEFELSSSNSRLYGQALIRDFKLFNKNKKVGVKTAVKFILLIYSQTNDYLNPLQHFGLNG